RRNSCPAFRHLRGQPPGQGRYACPQVLPSQRPVAQDERRRIVRPAFGQVIERSGGRIEGGHGVLEKRRPCCVPLSRHVHRSASSARLSPYSAVARGSQDMGSLMLAAYAENVHDTSVV